MILANLTRAIREQNWFAVLVEFFIVVLGLLTAFLIESAREAAEERQRAAQLIEMLRVDLQDALQIERSFIEEVDAGLAAWHTAREQGETPPPFFIRITGSDTPPTRLWDIAAEAGLAELVHPSLIYELSHFQSEREGVGVKFERYSVFVETEIIPLLYGETAAFYLEDKSALKPEFRANMDRLVEWRDFLSTIQSWNVCLGQHLERPLEPTRGCDVGEYEDGILFDSPTAAENP